jgi:hypothetical protein
MTVDAYKARFHSIETLFELTQVGLQRIAERVPLHRMAEPYGIRLMLAERFRANEERYRRDIESLEAAWVMA